MSSVNYDFFLICSGIKAYISFTVITNNISFRNSYLLSLRIFSYFG